MSYNNVEFDSSVKIWGESTTEFGVVLSVSLTKIDEIVDKGTISEAEISASSVANDEYGLAIKTNYYYTKF